MVEPTWGDCALVDGWGHSLLHTNHPGWGQDTPSSLPPTQLGGPRLGLLWWEYLIVSRQYTWIIRLLFHQLTPGAQLSATHCQGSLLAVIGSRGLPFVGGCRGCIYPAGIGCHTQQCPRLLTLAQCKEWSAGGRCEPHSALYRSIIWTYDISIFFFFLFLLVILCKEQKSPINTVQRRVNKYYHIFLWKIRITCNFIFLGLYQNYFSSNQCSVGCELQCVGCEVTCGSYQPVQPRSARHRQAFCWNPVDLRRKCDTRSHVRAPSLATANAFVELRRAD